MLFSLKAGVGSLVRSVPPREQRKKEIRPRSSCAGQPYQPARCRWRRWCDAGAQALACTHVIRECSATLDRRPPGLHLRAPIRDGVNPLLTRPRGTASMIGAGESARRRCAPAGRGSDVPAPRRFAARRPVRVSRAYARDGQANGLRTKSTKGDRRLRPAPRRESERTNARESRVTLRCTRRGGRDRSKRPVELCAADGAGLP